MSWDSRFLGLQLTGLEKGNDILILMNAHMEGLRVELAKPTRGKKWLRFVDTSLPPPQEITELGQEKPIGRQTFYEVGPRSVVVLVAQ